MALVSSLRDIKGGPVSWRYRFHRWLHDSPGSPIRWVIVNFSILVALGFIPGVIDATIGRDEMRGSLTIWFAFVVGITGVAVFNIIVRLLALDYNEVKDQFEDTAN